MLECAGYLGFQTPWQSKVICRSGTMPLNLIVAATSPDSDDGKTEEALWAGMLLLAEE